MTGFEKEWKRVELSKENAKLCSQRAWKEFLKLMFLSKVCWWHSSILKEELEEILTNL